MTDGAASGDGRGPQGPGSSGRAGAALVALVVVAVLLYSLLVVQQVLLGVLVATAVVGTFFLVQGLRRFARHYRRRTAAIESIAESLEGSGGEGGADTADPGPAHDE